MKILKPGKVEMRKFVCHKCGCTFVAENTETSTWGYVTCPQEKCLALIHWQNSEPYEGPTQDTKSDRARLAKLIQEWKDAPMKESDCLIEDCMPFLSDYLIANGVTFGGESR